MRGAFDRPLIAFFALAYAIAWAVLGVASLLADAAGLSGAVELITRAEALDFAEWGERLPVPTWLVYALTRVADFSFTLSAVAVIAWTGGRQELLALGRRLLRWRFALRWYALALVPALFYAVAAFVAPVDGALDVGLATLPVVLFSAQAGVIFHLLLRGPLGEEPGLRGFALVRMRDRVGSARASLWIGLLWAGWHLPVLLGRDPVSVAAFLVVAVLLSFVMTFLFEGSGGSLLPPLLFHAFQNTEEAFELVLPGLRGTDWETTSTVALLVFGLLISAWVWRGGRAASGPSHQRSDAERAG